MKILFALGNVYPHDDANSMIVSRLARELMELDKTTSIIELGLADDESHSTFSRHEGIDIYRLRYLLQSKMSCALREFFKSFSVGSRAERLKLLSRHPQLLIEYVVKRLFFGSIGKFYRIELERICRNESVDLVVCVSFPFWSCIATAKAKLAVPFIYYQLDPYHNHYQQKWKYLAQRRENFVCKKTKHVVLTSLIYEDYMHSRLKSYLVKSTTLEFPSIRPIPSPCSSEVIVAKTRTEGVFRFLFLGSTYVDIRSPDYCYALLHRVLEAYPGIEIKFVGPVYGSLSATAKNFENLLGPSFKRRERVSAVDADQLMNEADFLVNIGNTVQNQMPSKIFEYFSTGKPIINFYKISECPTLNYTYKYPYCLNIPEFRPIDDNLVSEFIRFCSLNFGKRLTYTQVRSIFPDSTVEAVGAKFKVIIGNVLKSK